MGAKKGQRNRQAGVKRLALIVFGALFVVLFAGFAIAQGIGEPSVPSGDVALVESVPGDIGHVSEAEYRRALAQQVANGGLKTTPKKGSKKYEELKTAALGELLDTVWIAGEAEELGISVTEKQVETELANIKKQNFPTEKAYKEFLETSHFTQEDVDKRVELQLLSTKIQEKVTTEAPPATSSEIEAYYEAEKASQFTEKPSRDVRVILNKDKAKVEKAKEELEADDSPASWKKVAAKYSSDPTTKSNGGLQKGVTEEVLQEPLKKAIFGAAQGELVGPTKYQAQYLLTEVAAESPEKVKPLKEVRSQISATLTQQKQQEHFSEFINEFQSKWTSRTFCAAGYEIERCANYTSSGHPASASPACYEANPKTPATECPAPVELTKPALPGSVTIAKPGGEPFVQRPFPEPAGEPTGTSGEGEAPEGTGEEPRP